MDPELDSVDLALDSVDSGVGFCGPRVGLCPRFPAGPCEVLSPCPPACAWHLLSSSTRLFQEFIIIIIPGIAPFQEPWGCGMAGAAGARSSGCRGGITTGHQGHGEGRKNWIFVLGIPKSGKKYVC